MRIDVYVIVFLIGLVCFTWEVSSSPWSTLLDDERDEAHEMFTQHKIRRELQQFQDAQENPDLRLPTDLTPISYDIELLPFIEDGNFTTHGTVHILLKCERATPNITMNAANLTIDESSMRVVDVTNGATTNIPITPKIIDDQESHREMITIQVMDSLVQGNMYKVTIKFVSILNDELRGFYRSSYEENGVTKYLAVSQMEAPDARRAFPCFDEPSMKATFKVTLGRRSTWKSASNMPIAETKPIEGLPGYEWDIYQESVKMSTYLVAFLVSEFEAVNSTGSLQNVNFRVWARPVFRDQTRYANDIGPVILKFFEYYFRIDYPLPKQDMAAIPDFAAGAMENWGLITYREADLLIDGQRSSEVAKQRVAEVVAHELAHQWFGNLVTMDWWNVIWLNEGFARYMQYVGTHVVEPSFRMHEQFGATVMHAVFGIDALESSRPIDMQVKTVDEINAMFDSISYDKGACIIRMCANFLGINTFEKGVTRYLNTKAYGNAVQDDLWEALQAQATADLVQLPTTVKNIMDSWTSKMGYPLIVVNRTYGGSFETTATQSRFLLHRSNSSNENTVYRWWVPLTYSSNFDQPQRSVWLPSGSNSMNIGNIGASNDQWVIFNVDQAGYYRVMYDEINFGLIVDQLIADHRAIPEANRAQLLDDSLNLARANLMSYNHVLELTRYLNVEREYVPWTAATRGLDYLDMMLYGLPDYNEWRNYMSGHVEEFYTHTGFMEGSTDAHLFIYARSHAVTWACIKLGLTRCIDSAKNAYSTWMTAHPSRPITITPNLRRWIMCTAIANGGQSEWQFGYLRYLDSTLVNEKIEFLRAITCSRDPLKLNEMLNMSISNSSGIRLQDLNTVFAEIAANPVGHELALNFLSNQWNDVTNYIKAFQGFGGGSIPSLFRSLCNRVNTQAKLDKLLMLHTDPMKMNSTTSKTVLQGLEVAQANVQWVARNHQTVIEWLKLRNGASTTTTTTTSTRRPTSEAARISSHLIVLLFITFIGCWMHHN